MTDQERRERAARAEGEYQAVTLKRASNSRVGYKGFYRIGNQNIPATSVVCTVLLVLAVLRGLNHERRRS